MVSQGGSTFSGGFGGDPIPRNGDEPGRVLKHDVDHEPQIVPQLPEDGVQDDGGPQLTTLPGTLQERYTVHTWLDCAEPMEGIP